MVSRFQDRLAAGRLLAEYLGAYANRSDVLVLALPRGGVPVAYEVARSLKAPLDVFIVRKLGVPGHEELAMGAVATGGVRVLNEDVVRALRIPDYVIDAVTAWEREELTRRERLYRGDRPAPAVQGRTVILVDDGLATGATMLRAEVDDVICAITPEPFQSVGLWYKDFSQTTDDEVRESLARAAAASAHGEDTDRTQEKPPWPA
jgi:putative phosphoribosyl transferase